MPPRHGGIVEADVRREAAPDARPALLEHDHPNPLVLLIGEVAARRDERLARLVEPVGLLEHRTDGLRHRALAEHRRAPELAAPAVRARRHLVELVQRYRVAAAIAAEATGAGEGTGRDGVGLSSEDSADSNE